MSNVLIVGASRGIGFELARQMAERGERVFATTRDSGGKYSTALEHLGATVVHGIDVTREDSVSVISTALNGAPLDMLICNAGILTRETWDDMDFDRIRHQFEVNTLGPLRIVSGLRDRLAPGARVGIVTSRVGSIGDNGSGGNYGYRMSKAAANMVGKNLSHDLHPRGVAVALLHPGLVATRMTGGTGIQPAEAASGLIERMDELDLESSGAFWHAEGYPLPW